MNIQAIQEHRIHLYANAEPVPRPPGTQPPLRVELLPQGDLHDLMLLVAIMFSIPGLPALRWNNTSAWLDIPPMVAAPVFGGSSGFIAALPELQAWLAAWSMSERRQPDLAPDWAQRLKVDQKTVEEIADAIRRELATADETVLRFCDASGNEQRFIIPARASLRLPRVPVARTNVLVVKAVQRVHIYTSQTGLRVGVTMPADDAARRACPSLSVTASDIRPTRLIRVDSSRLINGNE